MATSLKEVQELGIGLTAALRDKVRPHLGSFEARTHAGTAVGGDVTFGIDEEAERFLVEYLRQHEANVAVYSEDQGLLEFGEPEYILIVDPVDGTRPAAAGLECAMVSVAVAELKENPTMADVVFGCLQEIKGGDLFTATRGAGVDFRTASGEAIDVRLSGNTDLASLFWTIGFRGRPSRALIETLGDLVDESSVEGAVFDLGSATYSITRILTGQLDAYVDIGPRMIDDVPEVRPLFEEVGKGAVLNNSPHDLAAAALICAEAGASIGDGDGRPLDGRLLLGSDHSFQMACIAAANQDLWEKLVAAVDAGIENLHREFGNQQQG